MKSVIVTTIDEEFDKSRVKGFVRTRKGKMERVDPFERKGGRSLREVKKQHNKNVRDSVEYWFSHPVEAMKIAKLKAPVKEDDKLSWEDWTWDEDADKSLDDFKMAIKYQPIIAGKIAALYRKEKGERPKPKKLPLTEEQKEFKKYGITARKYGGDDMYSWAVFRNGRPMMTGLGHSEVGYYKKQVLNRAKGE